MIIYKLDVLQEIKEAGYNAPRIRDEKPISQSALQEIREGKMIGINTLNALCAMLKLQPGNLIRYVEDDSPEALEAIKNMEEKARKKRLKKGLTDTE